LADLDEIWSRSTLVAVVDEGVRVVVLDLSDLERARPLVLEGSAAAVWHALAEPGTARQVAAAVARDFGLPATEVEPDVRDFLASLRRRGLAVSSLIADTDRPSTNPCR
jgi:hypothetical protein